MSYGVYAVVILVTFMGAMLGGAKLLDWLDKRADWRIERETLLAQLEQATANVQLPHAGQFPTVREDNSLFSGAQDPSYELAPVPWDLASAAYALGQQRADQDEAAREAEILWMIEEYKAEQAKRGEG